MTDRQLLEKALEALEPLAREADRWLEMGDTRPISGDTYITVGDLRRALGVSFAIQLALNPLKQTAATLPWEPYFFALGQDDENALIENAETFLDAMAKEPSQYDDIFERSK